MLGLSDSLVETLEKLKIVEPTEIQEKTIPLALAGRDVIGESATGSGKTLAFGSCIVERLQGKKGVQALVLTPTRELAEQNGKSLKMFARHTSLRVATVYGGVGLGPQTEELQRADVVVGTPGRILDHLERRTLNLRNVSILVLDEADRMLDMGFIEDVTTIINACPKNSQTLLFSATISSDIAYLAKRYMRDSVGVSSKAYVDTSKLAQAYYDVPKDQKFSLLVHLLKNEHGGLVMVFCNTRRTADYVGNNLSRQGIKAMTIHGGLTQAKRNSIMKHFHDSHVYVLVCTDVAARGLDIKGVSHVYNYEIPVNSKDYIHRIGRTARAGEEGKAISLVSERDYDNFRAVLRDPSLHIASIPIPAIERVFVHFSERRDSRQHHVYRMRGTRNTNQAYGNRRTHSRMPYRQNRSRYNNTRNFK